MLLALLRRPRGADPAGGSTYAFVPATISADGQRLLAKIGRDRTAIPTLPEPGDHTGWARLQAAATSAREVDLGALETQGVAVSRVEIGDAAYFDLRPRGSPTTDRRSSISTAAPSSISTRADRSPEWRSSRAPSAAA